MIPTMDVIVNRGRRALGVLAVTVVEGEQAKSCRATTGDTTAPAMVPAAGNFPQHDRIRTSAFLRAT